VRFLVAAGVAIFITASAKTIDVLSTPFGATFDPTLQLPYALSGFVFYGVGLALLFFTLAAHFALARASLRLARSRAALAAGALLSGAVIVGYVPWAMAMGLRWIIPEEQPRFLIVVSVSNLHLVADGLLLIWLGLRLWRLRPPVAG
jgi:hypothetical protein